jgi:hypothetical protein
VSSSDEGDARGKLTPFRMCISLNRLVIYTGNAGRRSVAVAIEQPDRLA